MPDVVGRSHVRLTSGLPGRTPFLSGIRLHDLVSQPHATCLIEEVNMVGIN